MESRASVAHTMNKAILCCVIMLGLGLSAYSPTPTPFDASTVDYSKFSEADIAATEVHRDQLKAQVKDSLNSIVTTSDAQGKTLQAANKAFEDYRQATEAQISKGNQAIAALNHVLQKLHLAKYIACGLVLVVAAFVALKVPAFGVYVGGAIAVGGIAAVWIFL